MNDFIYEEMAPDQEGVDLTRGKRKQDSEASEPKKTKKKKKKQDDKYGSSKNPIMASYSECSSKSATTPSILTAVTNLINELSSSQPNFVPITSQPPILTPQIIFNPPTFPIPPP